MLLQLNQGFINFAVVLSWLDNKSCSALTVILFTTQIVKWSAIVFCFSSENNEGIIRNLLSKFCVWMLCSGSGPIINTHYLLHNFRYSLGWCIAPVAGPPEAVHKQHTSKWSLQWESLPANGNILVRAIVYCLLFFHLRYSLVHRPPFNLREERRVCMWI